MFVFVTVLGTLCVQSFGASIIVVNESDDNAAIAPKALRGVKYFKFDLNPTSVTVGQNRVLLLSAPAVDSSSSPLFRTTAMAGMFGDNVQTDRSQSPPAYYVIPSGNDATGTGLIWSDLVSTPNTTSGNRIVAPISGDGMPSQFEFEFRTTLTNFPASTRFGIATNSSGAELTFSPTFVGFDYGPDGVFQSTRTGGQWVAGGDDRIIMNGPPSASGHISAFARLGASMYFVAQNAAEIKSITDQFKRSVQYITGILYKNGVQVASNTVATAGIQLVIMPVAGSNVLTLSAKGGQPTLPYWVEMTDSLDGQSTWHPVGVDRLYSGYAGSSISVTNHGVSMFFRSRLVAP